MQAAGVEDRVRTAAQTIYQALIDAELTSVVGAGSWELTDQRVAQRNGGRPRTLTTTAGYLELRIPKLRAGSFFPSLLERRRRVAQALFAVVMEAYLNGTSTRKVDDLVKALGADTGISKVGGVADLRGPGRGGRRVPGPVHAGVAYPYVFLDAASCKARVNRWVRLPGGGDRHRCHRRRPPQGPRGSAPGTPSTLPTGLPGNLVSRVIS